MEEKSSLFSESCESISFVLSKGGCDPMAGKKAPKKTAAQKAASAEASASAETPASAMESIGVVRGAQIGATVTLTCRKTYRSVDSTATEPYTTGMSPEQQDAIIDRCYQKAHADAVQRFERLGPA
jgi:hypothetical protein